MVLANVQFVGAFDDGRFIFLGPERIAENAESPARGMRTFSGYSSDGTELDSLQSAEGLMHDLDQHQMLTFTGTTAAVARANQLFYGNGTDDVVQTFESSSGEPGVFHLSAEPVQVTPRVIEEHEAALQRLIGDRMREGPPRPALYAETLPVFSELLVSAEGELWVGHYRPLFAMDEDRTYTIFDRAGNEKARLRLPARFELFEVAAGRAYVVERDENDVQYVHVYEIREP